MNIFHEIFFDISIKIPIITLVDVIFAEHLTFIKLLMYSYYSLYSYHLYYCH